MFIFGNIVFWEIVLVNFVVIGEFFKGEISWCKVLGRIVIGNIEFYSVIEEFVVEFNVYILICKMILLVF